MADPISLGTLALTAAGAGVSAFGASESAHATANMYQYKAAVAQANQQIAHQNALRAREVGDIDVQRAGLKGGQQLGQMTVDQGASGLALGSGSAALTRKSQLAGIQSNEGTIAADASQKAYGYEVDAMNYSAEGGLDKMSASNALAAGQWQVASSLLGGATGVADKWQKYSTAGVPGFSGGGDFFKSLFSGGAPITG